MTDQQRLEEALKYAIQIIESYQMDIRSRPELIEAGFCQGVIYREAIRDIRKRAGMEHNPLGDLEWTHER